MSKPRAGMASGRAEANNQLAQLRSDGLRRRAALVAAGCSTYRLGFDHHVNARQIICLCCGVSSFNSSDIENRYCGMCRTFHSEWREDDRA